MTVCIGGLADHEKQLVLVSDSKVSFGDFSSDAAVAKGVPFLPDWSLLMAGNDIGLAGPVIRRARTACRKQSVQEPDEIAEIIYAECQRERSRVIDGKVLDKHGFNTATFKASGKRLCSDTVYYDLYSKVEKVSLSLNLLLCGFDSKGVGHLRYVDAETPPLDYDPLGFYAIGTGANAALSSLCHSVEHLYLSRDSDLETVAYHCLAAKFMAESASDVGKDTWLISMKKDSPPRVVTPLAGMDYLRNQWEKHGAPRIPKGIEVAVKDLLMTPRESLSTEGIARAVKYSPRRLKGFKGMNGIGSQK